MKYLDMYGQPIRFKYKDHFNFSTNCGLCVSIFVIIIILIYLILFIIDITKMNQPTVLNVPESLNPPPSFTLVPDYIGFFDEIDENSKYIDKKEYTFDEKLPSLFGDKTDQGFQQIMFGIKYENKWVNINASIFSVNVYNYIEGKPIELFYSKCKRVPHVSESMYELYDLSEVYCIYSPFELSQDEVHDNYKYVKISANLCENDKYYNHSLENYTAYKNLKNSVGGKLNITIKEEIYVDTEPENNKDPIECVSDDIIKSLIPKYNIYFLYVESLFNQTNKNEPITRVVDWKYSSLSYEMSTKLNAYFQINKLSSYKSVIPKYLGGNNESETFVSFNNEKYTHSPDELNGTEILSISIKSSDTIDNYERTYITLFEIIGQIGGLCKFILILGFILFLIGNVYEYEESLINDFYDVVDPKYNDKTEMEFEDFLDKLNEFEKNVEEIKEFEQKQLEEKKKKETVEEEEYENSFTSKEFEEEKEKEKKEKEKKKNEEEKINNIKKNMYVNEKEKIFIHFFQSKKNELQETKNKYYKQNETNKENEEEKEKEKEEKKNENSFAEIDTNKKEDNIESSNVSLEKNEDKEKAKYNIAKLVYAIYINKVYSGLHFSLGESWLLKYCFCCLSEDLKNKKKVFENALKSLRNDTDFITILDYVQSFESLKKTFLKRETQLALFKALANKPFYSIENDNYVDNNKKDDKVDNGKNKFEKDLNLLYDNLMTLVNNPRKEEDLIWEEELLKSAFKGKRTKYIKTVEELIQNLKGMIGNELINTNT